MRLLADVEAAACTQCSSCFRCCSFHSAPLCCSGRTPPGTSGLELSGGPALLHCPAMVGASLPPQALARSRELAAVQEHVHESVDEGAAANWAPESSDGHWAPPRWRPPSTFLPAPPLSQAHTVGSLLGHPLLQLWMQHWERLQNSWALAEVFPAPVEPHLLLGSEHRRLHFAPSLPNH